MVFLSRSSFRRKPESSSLPLLLKCRASTRPAGERVTFLTPGILPSAALPPASLFAPLLRRSACAKKVTKESTPPVARSPGILPCDFARPLRGSLSAHPCAHNERARIVRAPLRAFPAQPRRATGGPFRRHPAAEATAT